MINFEFLGFNAAELGVLVYFIIGSYSLGYLLLRTGWPRIRILDENYRVGWSIIFGSLFSLLWVGLAVLFNMQSLFPIVLTITLVIAIIVFSIKRKFFASKNITVAVPKEKAAAQVIAEKSIERFLADRDFILNKSLSSEQIEKIQESLKQKGQ